MELWLSKDEDGVLVPCDKNSRQEYQKMVTGKKYRFEARSPRNTKFHRKFFALIKVVYDQQEHFNSEKVLRSFLLIKAGFFNDYIGPYGQYVSIPESISFASMKQEKFEELYESVIDAAVEFLGDVNACDYSKDLIKESVEKVLDFVG